MSRTAERTAAVLAAGIGLMLVTGIAGANELKPADTAKAEQGAVTLDRGRGTVRFGGGHRYHPRYYAVPRHRHRHGGAWIAGGIAAGIAGAIIANEIYRPRYYSAPRISCAELEDRCDAGQDWACRRLDDDPRC